MTLTAKRDAKQTLTFLKEYLDKKFNGKIGAEELLELMAELAADVHQLQLEVIALKGGRFGPTGKGY